jgi:uncharacterized protein
VTVVVLEFGRCASNLRMPHYAGFARQRPEHSGYLTSLPVRVGATLIGRLDVGEFLVPADKEASVPEHPNVQRIRSAYDAFAAADLNTALKDLAPDAVFHFNGSGPLSGDHTGIDEITKALVGTFEVTAGTQKLDIASIFADDRHGVVVLRETASRPDGVTLDVDEVHVLAIDSEGRITDLWDLPSDPESHDRFFDGE